MDGNQIMKIVSRDQCLQEHFRGIFARDKVPKWLMPGCFIWNTALHDAKGEHWVAIYISINHDVEFFDSFGEPPRTYGWNISGNVKFNKKVLQSSNSDVCGMYCLFFLYFRCRGLSMKSILDKFSINTVQNDAYVLHFTQLMK